MTITRRNLAAQMAVAGALAFAAPALIGAAYAENGDEAAVKKGVDELRVAIMKQDKAKLDALTMPQLSYSHSDARIQNKAEFIDGVMNRKATVKSLDFPDLWIAVAGTTAIARHLWVSESEQDGKTTNTKIGVMQVWQKQGDGSWKLLARSSYRLPDKA